MSEYQEITEWMFGQIPMFQNVGADAYKPGLDTMRRLCEAFGNPERKFKTIHVGGTNGKGSTSSLIASVLTESGRRTGLYTSPHLVDFRERIRIDGQMISEDEVVDFIKRYRALDLGLEPSFFELTTIMAFDHFARHGAECAVIEVGLGGRLDSTNVITPEVSVITNISLDHTALLGHTEPEIAREKAGIIKPGVPAVIGHASGDVLRVFTDTAAACGSPVILAGESPAYSSATLTDTHYIYKNTPWGDLTCPLTGDCQPENANTALHALQLLSGITPESVARGFANVTGNTGLMGRWTQLSDSPRLICDTGHNPGGWQHLAPRLCKIASEGTLRMVIGFVADKDISHILDKMPRNAIYYFTSPSVRRGLPAAELARTAGSCGLCGRIFESVADAVDTARAEAADDDTIFVGGSTFVVADLLSKYV